MTMESVPLMEGRRTRLRFATEDDVLFMLELANEIETNLRFRFAGASVSREQARRALWDQALAQLIIESTSSRKRLGFFTISSPDFHSRHAHFSVLGSSQHRRRAALLEGAGIGINYAFSCWDLRILYAEVAEFNLVQFQSGRGRYFEIEGIRQNSLYAFGEYWDVYILAVHREAWEAFGRKSVERLRVAGNGRPARVGFPW